LNFGSSCEVDMRVLWFVVLGVVVMVLVRLLYAPSPKVEHEFNASTKFIVVKYQQRYVYVALAISLIPWTVLVTPLVERDNFDPLVGYSVIALVSSVGVFLLVQALRRFVFSPEGVEVRGPFRFRFTWAQLVRVVALENGLIGVAKLKFGWMTIPVDSSMDGFRQLVRALEVWPTGEAKTKCEEAVRTLRRWHDDSTPTR
jgi:hypothetical protein